MAESLERSAFRLCFRRTESHSNFTAFHSRTLHQQGCIFGFFSRCRFLEVAVLLDTHGIDMLIRAALTAQCQQDRSVCIREDRLHYGESIFVPTIGCTGVTHAVTTRMVRAGDSS